MKTSFYRAVLLLTVMAVVWGRPAPLMAQESDDAAVDRLVLRDESLAQVLSLLERFTGKSIVRPQALPSVTFTFNSTRPMSRDEVVLALETLLSLNGIGVAPLGDNLIKVVPLAQLRGEAPSMITESTLDLPPSGRMASKLFQLEFLRVGEFVPQIQPILSPAGGAIVPFEKANAALVTDSIANLQRVERLLETLDHPASAGLRTKFYTLQYAKASELVNRIKQMTAPPVSAFLSTGTSLNADDRTNQVILVGDSRQFPVFDDWISRLDVRSDPNTRNEVITLKHADSQTVATLLSQLVSGQNAAIQTESARPRATREAAEGGESPASQTTPTVLSLGEMSTEFSRLLTILPEERTNSIVVSGTVDDIRLIRELVEKIDVILAQVRIEVLIAEVLLDADDSIGLKTLGITIDTDDFWTIEAGGRGFNITGTLPEFSLEAALSAARTRSDVNILSVPAIVTTHNKEARIFVGEARPIITGFQTDAATGIGGFRSTVQFRDIGIGLTVKPLIGQDGNIQLEIQQQVEDVLGTVLIDNTEQPRIGRRETESFISVSDRQVVVLGGLQRSKQDVTRARLGILGQIPVLGALFGSRDRSDEKTELLIFIRPTVLPDTMLAARDADRVIDQSTMGDRIRESLNADQVP